MNFQNKIAIITGGTGALGSVIVNRFAEEGMKIYVPTLSIDNFRSKFDNSQESSIAEFKLRKIYALQCDASSEVSVINFIDNVLIREGRIDYLINTVGGYHAKKNILDMETALIEKMMKLNFYSSFYFCKYSLKRWNYGDQIDSCTGCD